MRDFIKNELINTRNKNMKTFAYQHTCTGYNNGDVISMKGTVKNNCADFEITRTKANGDRCSSVPVYGMPLTDDCISQIVEIALEAL